MKSNNGKTQILFGFVTQPLNHNGFGIVIVDDYAGSGRPRSFGILAENGPRFIYEGVSAPCFESTIVKRLPSKLDTIALQVFGTNGDMKVVAWGYAKYWQDAERGISLRPHYRVIRDNLFLGKVMGKKFKNEIVFEGNIRELDAESFRDGLPESVKDKFAPVYRNAVFTTKNRFELRDGYGKWIPCEDPRPFPNDFGPVYRLMHWKDGKDEKLAEGTALRINWSIPRGDNDPLAKYVSNGESGGYIYWMRQEPAEQNSKETIWVETSDPRLLPTQSTIVPTPRRSLAAMPKKPDSTRQFHTKLTSLDQLALA